MQQKRTKDSREWTTLAQKAYLVSKQSEYLIAQGTRSLPGWFSVELEKYFDRFPTEPVTATEIAQHGWGLADKRKFQETRIKTWFKNHTRPTTLKGNQKRELFKLTKPKKKLASEVCFSKLFYKRRYKGPITSKWEETYLSYYERMEHDLDTADPGAVQKKIKDAIRQDLKAGSLDITVVAAEGEDESESEDEGEDESEDEEDENEGGEDNEDVEDDEEVEEVEVKEVEEELENEASLSHEASDVKLPMVPVWYRNAVTRDLWKKASPSQKKKVEKFKKKVDNGIVGRVLSNGQTEDDMNFNLLEVMSARSAVERYFIGMLDQIFKQTGLVGSVCLAGPDPEKGGKLMTMSISNQLANGSNFSDIYRGYKKAVADPMRSYSALFFPISERSKWALPGTGQQQFNQQQEVAALNYVPPSVAPATFSKPSVFSQNRPLAMAHANSPQKPSLASNHLEMDEGLGNVWKAGLKTLQTFDDGVDEANIYAAAMQDWVVDDTAGKDVTENIRSQTAQSSTAVSRSTTPNVPASGLRRVSESGKKGKANKARNDDTMGLEGQPATRTTPTLNGLKPDTITSSRPVRSKTVNASGLSASSENSRKRGRERGDNPEPPSKRPVTRSSQAKLSRPKRLPASKRL